MHSHTLAWVLVILVDDRLTGEFRDTHDAVGMVHTILLDRIDGRVDLATRTVEISGMNVDAERFA